MWMAWLLAIAGLNASPPDSITVFDLSYTLAYDHKDLKQVAKAWDHCHAVATLQGNVNRAEPRLYLRYVNSAGVHSDDYWLKRMSEPGQWLHQTRQEPVANLLELIERFRPAIKGVVVYDPAVPATSNLASSIAGAEELIAVRYDPAPDSLYHALVLDGPRLPVVRRLLREDGSSMFTGQGIIPDTQIPSTGSAKCDAYLWLKQHYLDTGRLNARFGGFYIDAHWLKGTHGLHPNTHTLTNHDFFVARRGFFFDLGVWEDEAATDDPGQRPGTDLRTLKALLQSAYEHGGREDMIHIGGFTPWAHKYTNFGTVGGKHEPVPAEWEMVRVASAYNAFIDADALGLSALANASFFTHFPLKPRYHQRWVTTEDLKQRGYLDKDGKVKVDGREFMIFYVGDYDSAAWIYQFMPTLWDHPSRGRIPLMWCITPIAERRVSMALDYFYRTASKNDYFATADNGAGYLNPGMLQEPRPVSGLPEGLSAWQRHCETFYRRWDMSITGFIIDGFAPGLNQAGLDCYARFSPNGIVPQKIPPSLLHGSLPVLRADYDLTDAVDSSAARIVERVRLRNALPFHWFRGILKSPEWYEQVLEQARAQNPHLKLLDAPTFFELYRRYLGEHPDAANGKIGLSR